MLCAVCWHAEPEAVSISQHENDLTHLYRNHNIKVPIFNPNISIIGTSSTRARC